MRSTTVVLAYVIARLFWPLVVALVALIGLILFLAPSHARDDGRWAGSPLKSWFDGLQSSYGLCCSFADGRTVDDPDWGTQPVATAGGTEIRFWVMVDGQKVTIPPEAVVTVPNRYGRAVVWPYTRPDGTIFVRCFMAGTQS